MSPDLRAALREHFGYPAFRPGQEAALRHVLAGRDTLVVMPTGSGKSLIYQLAALCQPGTGLVVSPLIALMKDQVDGLARRNIPATFINSTLDLAEQNRRLRALAAGQYKLVLVAPERFRSPGFRSALEAVTVNLLAVDEAHCLSQWGHDFRPDYLYLAEARRQLRPPVTLALTATATPRVQDDIVGLLGLERAERVITGFNRPNLMLRVVPARTDEVKLRRLRDFLAAAEGAGLIYAGTRRHAESVAAFLRTELRRPAEHYHAALPPADRARVQEAFLSGDLPLVVATNAFGMGIDRPDVRFVVHYTMPGTLEAYYQEAGRAGRDGLPAEALLLYAAKDAALHEHFIEEGAPTPAELRHLHEHFRRLSAATGLAEIEAATKLTGTKVRVGLDQLELAGALRRADEAYGRLRLEAGPLTAAALRQLEAENTARRRHKYHLLGRMADYAQTGACRRQALLRHFGDDDAGQVEAEACCDNCAASAEARPARAGRRPAGPPASPGLRLVPARPEPAPAEPPPPAAPLPPAQQKLLTELSQAERAALIVLDAVARLDRLLGKGKLAQFLRGSETEAVADLKGQRHFGKFADLRLADIEALIDQLLDSGHLGQAGGLRPVLALTPLGENALRNRAALQVNLRLAEAGQAARLRAARSAPAGGTLAVTRDLLARGLAPDQIAAERGLTDSTIYSHLAELIAAGQVDVNAVVPPATQARIVAAIEAEGSAQYLAPIKARLNDFTTYGEIRCVAEAWKRGRRPADG
ncbi:MAG: RecQ family ATP-dependent DNA helicase [Anaerolineales bacterium]|nr:RecQ family ATP-dependent DNA helicase [Anaerolineales bacterium]